jgi:hypothetical protein
VAREPGLHRDVDQLPERRRLRPIVPRGAAGRRRRTAIPNIRTWWRVRNICARGRTWIRSA